jgi:hypothetical protein
MTMTCPEAGRLRAWLDDEAAEDEALILGEHLAGCMACQTTRETLDRDAAAASRALDGLAGPPPSAIEIEQALARLHRQLDASDGSAPLTGAARPSAMLPGVPLTEPIEVPAARTNGRASLTAPLLAASAEPMPDTVTPGSRPASTSTRRRFPVPLTFAFQRWRLTLSGLAAALALTFLVGTPEGRVAAAEFLAQFRSQHLTIVTFDPNQTRQTGLFRLEQLGTVTNPRPPQPAPVANVQEAASKAGFAILQPDPALLPQGASKTPTVRYSPASQTRLTFDKQKARTYFDSLNRKDVSLPDNMNGATLIVSLPPVVMLEYTGSDGKPSLMVGEAREIQVGVEGNVTLDEVRSFLLSMPGLPDDLARQLRSIQDWRSTLPIPIPVDKISWQDTTVAGSPGYLLNDNTGLGSAVIWQRNGQILGVAGPMKATDLKKLAESLR